MRETVMKVSDHDSNVLPNNWNAAKITGVALQTKVSTRSELLYSQFLKHEATKIALDWVRSGVVIVINPFFNWVSKAISLLLWFCFTRLYHSFANGKPNQNQSCLVTRVFPRLAPVTCICFEFWLADCVVYICCDWPEKLLWCWFYSTQLKTALSPNSDQHQISPCNINAYSTLEVMRIKAMIIQGEFSWYF